MPTHAQDNEQTEPGVVPHIANGVIGVIVFVWTSFQGLRDFMKRFTICVEQRESVERRQKAMSEVEQTQMRDLRSLTLLHTRSFPVGRQLHGVEQT